MRKPVKSCQLYVITDNVTPDRLPPQPAVSSKRAGCAPQLEVVRGRMLEQWKRGVSMKSLATMYQTTKDEVEGVLRDRINFVHPSLRRAA